MFEVILQLQRLKWSFFSVLKAHCVHILAHHIASGWKCNQIFNHLTARAERVKRVLYLREVRGCHNNKAAFLHAKSPPGLETSTFTFDASASTTPSTSNSSWWWWWRRWLFKISFLASMASLDPWFGLIMTQHHGILINPLHLKKDSLF